MKVQKHGPAACKVPRAKRREPLTYKSDCVVCKRRLSWPIVTAAGKQWSYSLLSRPSLPVRHDCQGREDLLVFLHHGDNSLSIRCGRPSRIASQPSRTKKRSKLSAVEPHLRRADSKYGIPKDVDRSWRPVVENSEEKFFVITTPARLDSTAARHLPGSFTIGKRSHVDFGPSGLVRSVRNETSVIRYLPLAFTSLCGQKRLRLPVLHRKQPQVCCRLWVHTRVEKVIPIRGPIIRRCCCRMR